MLISCNPNKLTRKNLSLLKTLKPKKAKRRSKFPFPCQMQVEMLRMQVNFKKNQISQRRKIRKSLIWKSIPNFKEWSVWLVPD